MKLPPPVLCQAVKDSAPLLYGTVHESNSVLNITYCLVFFLPRMETDAFNPLTH